MSFLKVMKRKGVDLRKGDSIDRILCKKILLALSLEMAYSYDIRCQRAI